MMGKDNTEHLAAVRMSEGDRAREDFWRSVSSDLQDEDTQRVVALCSV